VGQQQKSTFSDANALGKAQVKVESSRYQSELNTVKHSKVRLSLRDGMLQYNIPLLSTTANDMGFS